MYFLVVENIYLLEVGPRKERILFSRYLNYVYIYYLILMQALLMGRDSPNSDAGYGSFQSGTSTSFLCCGPIKQFASITKSIII